ncbi:YerC/YecD family TrpR-related protein [Desulforamulus aquiferis]|uniref:YerC/YecD family TrpR-related protein n=1 Tax=Desulforamulus aquiferis TaxID=1397668 RepID=A0AAW7ZI70_9FIRM|nr:YerC/YecD family TrpR-related protein [Desulforamulus aquiferis]MDO7788415.1 YerC/YecD family TrpR-related protein [Desulforamulus aquiferis]
MVYSGKLRDDLNDRLFEAILSLKDVDECYRFFEDISTVSELRSLAQRLEVAKMLEANRTYGDIAGKTGASTATISRVKRCLNYGADGYKLVLSRLSDPKPLAEDKKIDEVNE